MCVRVCECMHASHVQTQREDHTAPSGEQGTPFSPLIYFPAIKHAILYLISVNVVSFPHLSSSRSLVKCFVFVFFNDLNESGFGWNESCLGTPFRGMWMGWR